jgi:CheY-like chemotaxis protein
MLAPTALALMVVMLDLSGGLPAGLAVPGLGLLALAQLWLLLGARHAEGAPPAAPPAPVRRQATAPEGLRRPIGAVLGLLDLLLASSGLSRAARADVQAARMGTADLALLLRDMAEPGPQTADLVPVRIDETVEQVAALLRGSAAQAGTRLSTAIALGTHASWHGDPIRLRILLTHLAEAAIKATPGGEVRLEARQTGQGGLQLIVADTGSGMTADQQSRLFDAAGGAGAGRDLALCRDLATRLGAMLRVSSAVGRGTAIALALPWSRIEEPPLAATNPAPPPLRPRVLVVDDVPVNRRLLRALLERADCLVQEAEGGTMALAALADGPFDLVLMDIYMPGMEGLEATRRIRALRGAASRVPVLMVTSEDDPDARAAARAAGARGFLVKPVSLEELTAALAEVLSRARNMPGQG